MARPRRIISSPIPEIQSKPEPPAVSFTANTLEHLTVSSTPVLRFCDAAGKRHDVALSPDAERIWRRFTRGNL